MNVGIVKFIQSESCFINGSKFPEIAFFEMLYITIGHLIFFTLEHFIHISS
jgi:hypothetical protein